MKFYGSTPFLIGIVIWLSGPPPVAIGQVGTGAGAPSRTSSTAGATVVELFTSQGCSSCPPADSLLREIAARADKNDLPVYVLSFHVDYWNRLGWKDPYSDASFSQRQRVYSNAFGLKEVYTPQMVVGGATEFLGSNQSKAFAAVASALHRSPMFHIKLEVDTDSTTDGFAVRYTVSGAHAVDAETQGKVLQLAAVQNPVGNRVRRGENAGRRLSHVNVVRALRSVALDQPAGRVQFVLPDDLDPDDVGVIAYVQDVETGAIDGAASVGRFTPARR